MALEQGPEGLADPGRLPTTAEREVIEESIERSALRATRHRLEEMRTAVISARTLVEMMSQFLAAIDLTDDNTIFTLGTDLVAKGGGLLEAAGRWSQRFGALADPPLEVEVEEDDDEEHEPVEGAYDVREEEHAIGVYLRTDGSLEYRIGTISAPEELSTLLRLVADETVKARG
jgi:hypothetical protein